MLPPQLKIVMTKAKRTAEELEVELDAAIKVNTELTKEVANVVLEPAKPTLTDNTFKVDKTTYGFAIHAVIFEGQKITNADVLGSADLQKKLVDLGSGMIKEV